MREGKVSFDELVDKGTGRLRTLQELGYGQRGNLLANLRGDNRLEHLFGKMQNAPESIQKAAEAVNPNLAMSGEYSRNCQRCVPAYALRRRGYDVEAQGNPYPDRSGTSKRKVFGGWECFKNAEVHGYLGIEAAIDKPTLLENMRSLPDGAISAIIWTAPDKKSSHSIVCEKVTGQLIFVDPQKGVASAKSLGIAHKEYGYAWYRMDNLEIDETFEWDEIIKKKRQ